MTVETRDQSASGDDGKGSADANVVDLETLRKENEALKKHNVELLGEKKGALSKVAQFEKEKAELEEKTQQEKGEYKTLFEKEREKLMSVMTKTKSRVHDTQIRDGLRSIGCTDEKKLEKLMQFPSVRNYQDKVTFDDDYNADKAKLSIFVNEIKAEFSEFGFFSKEAPSSKDIDPANNESLTKEHRYEAEVKACKTIQELELVKKKHGKI